MELHVRTFWLPRRGHTPEAYEDAFAGPTQHVDGWYLAIADGATETAYAGPWARVLVETFTETPSKDWLKQARQRWKAALPSPETLPWYLAEKMASGASAAFLGLSVHPEGRLRAQAVGDCCLLHYRAGDLTAWPLETPSAFSHRPVLISSLPEVPPPVLLHYETTLHSGDCLLLATDALAACLIRQATPPVWHDATAFQQWVERVRLAGTLRNDDVTCMVLYIP